MCSGRARPCLTQRVLKVVLQKSIPTQIRQPLFHISNSKGNFDGFVGGVTYVNDLMNTFRETKVCWMQKGARPGKLALFFQPLWMKITARLGLTSNIKAIVQ